MSTQDIAVICWPLGPGAVAGRVAFQPWEPREVVRKTAASVVSALEEVLAEAEDWPQEVENPRIRRYTQAIRPSLREDRKVLALPFEVPFAFDVAVGELQGGLLLCEIVPFGRLFQVQSPGELDALVAHFVREEAATWSVEELLRWTLLPAARLETGRVRVREIEPWKVKKPPPPRLSAIAERADGSRSGPLDAAFRRELLVEEVAELVAGGVDVLLVGEPRVGKSAVLREAVARVAKRHATWRTTADRIPAGAKYLGEWQKLCDQLIDELDGETAALWVDDLARLVTLGGDTPESSVAAYLRPAMREGRIQLVGELTPAALDAVRSKLPGFFALFREVVVPELDEGALRDASDGIAGLCRDRLGASVEPAALALSIRLLERYAREERFPGKLADFLGVCASEATLSSERSVSPARVVDTFVRRTGLPPVLVDDRIPLDRPGLRAFLEARVTGQPEAVSSALEVITAFKAALNDARRPVATLLYAGPTGVGKTATARALAEWTFGQGPSTDPLIRIDMSELQHPGQVRRLVGGDGEPGELVRKVRERPFSVLLLDEIEKAHPVFFDVLLGLLDEGRLTDGWGRVTDFRGAIVVMTTNLGVRPNSSVGFGTARGDVDLGEIRRFFRPELLNRIDRVVRFTALSQDVVREIARRELAAVSERPGLKARKIELLFGEALVDRVVAAGFDPALGARPLQRAVEHWAVAPLAAWLLAHPTATGQLLTFEVEGERVVVG